MMALCSGISYSANSTILSAYSEKNRKRKDKAKKPRVDLSKTSYPNLNQTNYIMFSIFKYTCKIHTTIILSKLLQERDKTTNKFIPFFFSEKKDSVAKSCGKTQQRISGFRQAYLPYFLL